MSIPAIFRRNTTWVCCGGYVPNALNGWCRLRSCKPVQLRFQRRFRLIEIENDTEQNSEELKIPDLLPLLPIRDVVVYPFMIIPLFVGREMSVKPVDSALAGDRMILLATQHDVGDEDPPADKIYEVGTVAMIMRMLKLPDGRVKILVQGLATARITEYISDKPFYMVRVERQNDTVVVDISLETEALIRTVREQLTKVMELGKQV